MAVERRSTPKWNHLEIYALQIASIIFIMHPILLSYLLLYQFFRETRRQSLAVPTLEGTLGVRRHSVPVNVEPSLPRTIYRRESLPIGRGAIPGRSQASPVPADSRASSGLREEHELAKFGSQSSVVSSGSLHYSSGN